MGQYNLISEDQFKTYQKGTMSEELNNLIAMLCTYVTGRFEQRCQRGWDKKVYTRYFSFDRARSVLFLPETPIATTPAVKIWVDSTRQFGAETLLDASAYVLTPETGKVLLLESHALAGVLTDKQAWPIGERMVKAEFTGAFLEGHGVGTPGDLSLAALLQAGFLYQRRGELGLNSRSLEGGSFTAESQITLLPEVQDVLENYAPPKLTVL